MFKLPDFSTMKRLVTVATDNINEWAEEAEARAEKRAASRPQRLEAERQAVRTQLLEESVKRQKKLAETTFTTEEIEYQKAQYKKSLGWTDEQADEYFSQFTIKDKGISKEAQALNQATQEKAELAIQVQQLQQQLQAAQVNAQQQLQIQQLQQQNQQLQDRYNQLENEYHYLDCQNSPSKDLYYPLQQKNEQLQQQNQQLQQQLQEALAELAKHK